MVCVVNTCPVYVSDKNVWATPRAASRFVWTSGSVGAWVEPDIVAHVPNGTLGSVFSDDGACVGCTFSTPTGAVVGFVKKLNVKDVGT